MSQSVFIRGLIVLFAITTSFFVQAQEAVVTLTRFPLNFVPHSASLYRNQLYIHNLLDGSISVLDTAKNEVKKTISVESGPSFSLGGGQYIYVLNTGTNTVSVIDRDTLLVHKTLITSSRPSYATLVGTKLYISNSGDDSVSVLDTVSNLVVKTIDNLGASPTCSLATGNKLYVCNSQSWSVSLIDTSKNSVTTSFRTGWSPIDMVLVGKELYVLNNADNTITIINIDKNTRVLTSTLEETITVGLNPRSIVQVGTKLYTVNKGGNSVSVIDTNLKKVIKTIPVGKWPSAGVVLNNQLYITNTEDGTVSIIDTSSDTVSWTFSAENGVIHPIVVGTSVYVLNPKSKTFSIVTTQLPRLVSFDTDANDGAYGIGESINIFALFDRKIQQWSTMTIGLNNGPKVVLSTVKDTTLSGKYTIEKGQDKDKLTIESIVSSKIIDFTGREKIDYTIPVNKNIADVSNITIDTAKVVTLSSATSTSETDMCKNSYRVCPLAVDPNKITEYSKDMACEGFISWEVKYSKYISRAEVLEIGVNMLRKEKTPAKEYASTYTDIVLSAGNEHLVSVIQTWLENWFIFPNTGLFRPQKNISRIEAYALLMRGVCLDPAEWTDKKKTIYDAAFEAKITTKKWNRFRPNKPVTRNEVFLLASQLADWADINGGCDKLQCRK
jgi:YVTN family beta-propeller protein